MAAVERAEERLVRVEVQLEEMRRTLQCLPRIEERLTHIERDMIRAKAGGKALWGAAVVLGTVIAFAAGLAVRLTGK